MDNADPGSVRVLHVANWYPNPWNDIEGNFVRDQIRLYLQETKGDAIVVQIRQDPFCWLRLRLLSLEGGVRGFFLLTKLTPGKCTELLSTLLLVFAFLQMRVWRFDVLHFHIAYPLLLHVHVWRHFFRKKIVITEHWSAYHFNFYLPVNSRATSIIRKPFTFGFPVITVSRALLEDIYRFAQRNDFPGHVIPNVVPLHGAGKSGNKVPMLFTVNRWAAMKEPMPMLEGLAKAAAVGAKFRVVIGGYGDLLEPMKEFVARSVLSDRTIFPGRMTKADIAFQLKISDGYIFSSRYETFSIACAEALGAGVPLIGPVIPAIAEYAGEEDWQRVDGRDADAWAAAARAFVDQLAAGAFDRTAIAQRAATRFSDHAIRSAYRRVLEESLPVGARCEQTVEK